MTIISAPQQYNTDDLFVDLRAIVEHNLFLKVEGMNFAGPVKLKAAASMIGSAQAQGLLNPWSIVVESSSGNMGVALAMVCANHGYRFICVTDDRCNLQTRKLIEAFGGEVHVVDGPHPQTGPLGARIEHLASICAKNPDAVWLNQYENPANAGAHYAQTGPAIAHNFPRLDVVFAGAGTCGTLMGTARWFKQHRPHVKIVAIDVEGSVSFGGPAGTRRIPGLGMSMVPFALDRLLVDDVVIVPETETLRMCQRLATRGFLFGGSTGTVVAGAASWMNEHGRPGMTAMTLAPDSGERYLDTVYAPMWREEHYGAYARLTGRHVLPDKLPTPPQAPPA